jgi:prepilin-type N-terminal cleavage/methylation domain-containing protein
MKRHAFSLVELSIVLVILGLLVGGILAGQSLIRASELRSISSEQAKFAAAMHAFRDKYFAIPGDMVNATSFWGVIGAGPQCVTPALDIGTGTQTCNGDGNGLVAGTSDLTTSSTYLYESFRLWQQLASAGLIEGSYSGVAGPGGTSHYLPGQNGAAGRIPGSGWVITFGPITAGSTVDYTGTSGHYMQLGATSASATPNLKLLTPQESWNLDKKMDDGKPGLGRMRIKYWDDCTLATAETDLDADYDLSKSTIECVLKFRRFI